MSDVRIGISGWRYAPWRGDFYPRGLAQRRELEFASREVNSIEINGSFYGLQAPERYRNWAAQTPDGFVFSVKAPRFITHVRRLVDIDEPLANFFASGLLSLKEKLGPILWQFPPAFRFDEALFAKFVAKLPTDTDQARSLARHASARLHVAGYLDATADRPLRHAVGDPQCQFLRSGVHQTATSARHCPGGGRHGGQMALCRRHHRRFPLLASAWRCRALCQWIFG